MLTFKNHRGQFHKTNTALVALTSLYVIGAAVALSAPYWVSSTSMLAPLAAFAATPLGMGVLAFVAVALICLAVYAISKNNEISELKAPKIVVDDKQAALLVTKEVYEEIKKNNQVKDEKDKMKGKCYIDFSLEGKNYRIIVGSFSSAGNTLLLSISSLEVKNKEGEFEAVNKTEWNKTLGLDKDDAKEVNTYLGSLIVEQVASEEKAKS
ncbi:hypothetical protein NMD99_02075 [Wolbachia endosymbiont of Listronotus oregonensis]|uniref:hypothetical protein n=1 Tax=unclassified Wolbachia TaxID=2640676 RepID=UPI002226EE63|nr:MULTISPECIES: hypothetical protein [unclassified Wolbachia]MBV2146669.1 hypothetical protein [Wolbachia endosymbiont of Pissodes strobi]WMT84802.1 hypothetical protein NMD99_02075 [Wolbachia endosymbiont of Listronotus oregonensis]